MPHPGGRIIGVDLARPDSSEWETVVSETADTLEFATIVADRLVIGRLRNAHHAVAIHDMDGTLQRELDLPDVGTVTELTGKPYHRELFIGFQSFSYPTAVLQYDFDTDTLDFHAPPDSSRGPQELVTEQLWAEADEGTAIPVFITRHRNVRPTGNAPTILYGYGGFDISLTPLYAPDRIAFIEAGGIFAVANLRGGGEFGREWHQAGMLGNKQIVFDDFVCAAEHLIASGITTSDSLGIYGRSNGGLLVTACLLQRPDLFGAVVGMVPVTDMLRYHHFTAGRYWTPEYGNAELSPADYAYLIDYSPLHNVVEGVYPPTLITTGDTDDRVVPLHAYKFVAAMQQAAGESGPVLLRVDRRAGHGLGKPTAMVIDEAADIYAFFMHHLGPNT